jgi:PAS domain S-box-containing protein
MPSPKVITMRELASGNKDGLWVEVSGVVQSIQEQSRTWELELASEGIARRVTVKKSATSKFVPSLLNREIDIQGVAVVTSPRRQTDLTVRLLCPNVRYIRVHSLPIATPVLPPLGDISTIELTTHTNLMPHRERLMARIVEIQVPGEYLLKQGNSYLWVERTPKDDFPLQIGQWVEANGFPSVLRGEVRLRNTILREVRLRKNSRQEVFPLESPPLHLMSKTLYTIRDIRELPPDSVTNGYPVLLSGVVTLADSNQWLFFVEDPTGGIYVFNERWPSGPIKSGTRVQISGFTGKGLLAPIIVEPTVTPLADGAPPLPARTTIHALQTDQFDSRWVSIPGMVRSVEINETNLIHLEVSDGRSTLSAFIVDSSNHQQLEALAGRRVQISGVCGGVADDRGNFQYSRLILPNASFITLIEDYNANPGDLGLTAIDNVIEQSLSGSMRDIRLKGIVIGNWTTKSNRRIVVKDETGSIVLRANTMPVLRLGDQIEAIGFPDFENGHPVLSHARIQYTGHTNLPPPVLLTSLKTIGQRPINPTRVQADATLLFLKREDTELGLICQINNDLFEARVNSAPELDSHLPTGSLLRMRGILLGRGNSSEFPQRCLLLIHSPEDIVLLKPPTWWNSTRITIAVSTTLFILLVVLLWVLVLRRKVREQTEIIRRELESESALERRYHLIWDISADGMCMCDSQGIIIQVNAAYCRMVGKKPVELIGHCFSIIHTQEKQDFFQDLYKKDFASNAFPEHCTQEWTLWNGRQGWFELSNSYLEIPGSPPMLLSLIREVTERKHLEEQLRTAQKMEAIGRLAGGVAHDFNNILTVIQGYTGMLKEDNRIPADAHDLLEEIEKSAQRAADLTRQLLAFSRRQPLMAQIVDLSELVRNMMRLLTRLLGEDIRIEFNPTPIARRVRVDVGKIEQVLMNLTVNARDAMPKGGVLRIRVEDVTVTEAQAEGNSDRRPGEFILMRVEDTGCGMDESTLARIFEPFFTTKDIGKGTGLGLATVYGIVKQHSGWIEVTSHVGSGTTFLVYIPVHEAADESTTVVRANLSARTTGLILVVEDEPTVRHFVRYLLQRQGYSVLAASNGNEGLALWNQNLEEINLVLTDLIMPGAPNGRELGQRITKERPQVPVIYSSGFPLDTLPEKEGYVEDYNYLPKPYDSVRLIRVVSTRLRESRNAAGAPGIPETPKPRTVSSPTQSKSE